MDKQRKNNKEKFEKPFTSLAKLCKRIVVGAKFFGIVYTN